MRQTFHRGKGGKSIASDVRQQFLNSTRVFVFFFINLCFACGHVSPQFVGQLVGFTMVVKALNLRDAVTSRRLDHSQQLSVPAAKKGIGVFRSITGLGQSMFSDPKSCQLWSLESISDID
jgi:hypothetical protein